MTIIFFSRWFKRTSVHSITVRCLVSLVLVPAHHLLQLPVLRFPETVPDSQSSQRVSQTPLYVLPPVPRFDAPPTHHDHVPEEAPSSSDGARRDSSRFAGVAECSLCYVHRRGPSRSARQRRFTSPRPRPTGRNFVVHYIFIV